MADRNYALWAELERRSQSRPDLKARMDEAIKRGLLPARPEVEPRDITTSVRRGIPVIGGAMDELGGVGDAALSYLNNPEELEGSFGERVSEATERRRDRDEWYDTAHPYASTGGQLAGGVASGFGAAKAFPRAVQAVFGGPTAGMVAKTLRGGGASGVLGAGHGFTSGEGGVEERLKDAAWGGGMGTLIGGPLAMLEGGISFLTNRVKPKAPSKSKVRSSQRVQNALEAEGGDSAIPQKGPLVNAGQSLVSLGTEAGNVPGPGANFLRAQLKGGVPGIDPDAAIQLTTATKTAAGKEAALSFGKGAAATSPGLTEALVNVTTLKGLQPGTAAKDILKAIGGKMAQGRFDDDALETLNLLLQKAPDAAKEIADTMAMQAKNEATRNAIRQIVMSMAASTTPVAGGGGGGGGL